MSNESGIYGNFSINSSNWLFLSLQVSLFGYTIKTAFALSEWAFYYKIKPWAAIVNFGPFFFKIISDDKLTDYIYKVLKENEDKMHSES
jgi:hypothetical protein